MKIPFEKDEIDEAQKAVVRRNGLDSCYIRPIAFYGSHAMGVAAKTNPVLVAIAVFAAAALLTPVATPANLMVQEAAGYRFGDYWRLGLPLLLIYGLAGVFAVPMLWPF